MLFGHIRSDAAVHFKLAGGAVCQSHRKGVYAWETVHLIAPSFVWGAGTAQIWFLVSVAECILFDYCDFPPKNVTFFSVFFFVCLFLWAGLYTLCYFNEIWWVYFGLFKPDKVLKDTKYFKTIKFISLLLYAFFPIWENYSSGTRLGRTTCCDHSDRRTLWMSQCWS